jgi:hypothetical protein
VAFRRLRSTTQAARRSLIDRLCREHGDKSAVTLERRHILILMGAIADKPGAANNLRKALRELMKHAIDIGWRDDNPTRDVQKIKVQSNGLYDPRNQEHHRARKLAGGTALHGRSGAKAARGVGHSEGESVNGNWLTLALG